MNESSLNSREEEGIISETNVLETGIDDQGYESGNVGEIVFEDYHECYSQESYGSEELTTVESFEKEETAREMASRWITYMLYLASIVYVITVLYLDFKRGFLVFIIAIAVSFYKVFCVLSTEKFPETFQRLEKSAFEFMERAETDTRVGGPIIIMILVITVILALFSIEHLRNVASLGGFCLYIFLTWITSHDRKNVRWRPVLGALFVQYLMGYIVIKSEWGLWTIKYASEKVQLLLSFTKEGTSFFYGYLTDDGLSESPLLMRDGTSYFLEPPLFFTAFQTIIFFAALIHILYYLEVLQFVVKTLGKSTTEIILFIISPCSLLLFLLSNIN